MTQFARWMADAVASGLPEPTAMVLATITAEGRPRARTVLLKAHDQAGFTFYTNRTSRKGRDLAARPVACLVFPWYAIERQVIVEGTVVTAAGRERTLLPLQAARFADRRLGQQAVVRARVAG